MPHRALPSEAEYERLIDDYIVARDAERSRLEAEIRERFGLDATILVLDMSGFSRLTAEHGVIHYLAMVRRMRLLTSQLIGRHDGEIIKFEADNLFAWFPSVDAALLFAIAAQAGFFGMNVTTDDSSDIHVSVGVAAGEVLMIEGRDAWGAPMNLASRLGEDLAGKDEILIDVESFRTVKDPSRYETAPVAGLTYGGQPVEVLRVIALAV